MSEMTNSYTHHPESHYTKIENALIRSPSLSCKAFKLLCIGLSHAGWWSFYQEQIGTCFKEGMHTVKEAMKELRAAGYLHLVARQRDNGKWDGHQWFWFREPLTQAQFKKFHRDGGFPEVGDFGGSETHEGNKKTKRQEDQPFQEEQLAAAAEPTSPSSPLQLDPRLDWLEQLVGTFAALQLQMAAACAVYSDGTQGYPLWLLANRAHSMASEGNPPTAAWFRAAIRDQYGFEIPVKAPRPGAAAAKASAPKAPHEDQTRIPKWMRDMYDIDEKGRPIKTDASSLASDDTTTPQEDVYDTD